MGIALHEVPPFPGAVFVTDNFFSGSGPAKVIEGAPISELEMIPV